MRARLRLPTLFATLSLVLGASGCATVHRPSTTSAALLVDAAAERDAYRATRDTLIDRLARRAARRGDRTLDLLLLSGGGQNGAYGTGFLRAWSASGTMPRFDLVTGVSTGAVQAPLALLGTPAAFDTLTALYARAADRIAPTFDPTFWLRRTGGVVNTRRYEATIATVVDERMRAALVAARAEHRQLAVSTTDYDLGTGRLWDVGALLTPADTSAAARERALAAARRVLYTSTAIPGIFPPALLPTANGAVHVHGDGGIVQNVLPVLDVARYRALAARLRARGVLPADGADATRPVTVRLWVILNLWTHPAPTPVAPSNRRAIDGRSDMILFQSQQPRLLEELRTLGLAVTGSVPGVRLEVRTTAIPPEYALDPAARKLFDRAFMARLDSVGAARARGGAAWDTSGTAFAWPIVRAR